MPGRHHAPDRDARRRFGQNLRELRLAAELSQERFAETAGLHRTYVSGIERGERNISLDNIIRVSRALDISPGVLFEGVA